MDRSDDSAAPDTQDDTHELMPATPAGRRLGGAMAALLVLGLAGVGLLTLPWLQSALSPASASIDRIKAGFTILSLIVTGLAAALAATGWRIVRREQSPPPGALLWRTTRVVRGAPARRIGVAYCATGLLCGALGIGLGATMWIMLDRVTAPMSITLPPGVTILKQSITEAR